MKRNKENVRHPFLVSWSQKGSSDEAVNREILKQSGEVKVKFASSKNAEILAKESSLGTTKLQIAKSILLASVIFTFEIVLYFAWSR